MIYLYIGYLLVLIYKSVSVFVFCDVLFFSVAIGVVLGAVLVISDLYYKYFIILIQCNDFEVFLKYDISKLAVYAGKH